MKRKTYLFLPLIITIFSTQTIFSQGNQWLNFTTDDLHIGIGFDGDIVWSAYRGGLSKINKVTGETIYYNTGNSDIPSNYFTDYRFIESGTHWFSYYSTLTKFDGQEWTNYSELPNGASLNQARFLDVDDENNLWFRVADGVYKVNDSGDFSPLSDLGVEDNNIRQLLKTEDDAFWIVRFNVDNFEYIPIGQSPTVFDETNTPIDFQTENVSKISEDPFGNIYIVTSIELSGWNEYEYKIYKYDGTNFTEINFASVFPNMEFNNSVRFQINHLGNLHLECYGLGIFIYDGQDWTHYPFDDIETPIRLLGISPDGNMWVYSPSLQNNQLYEFDGSNLEQYQVSNANLSSNIISDLAIDNSENIVVVGSGGISVYDGYQWNNPMIPNTFTQPFWGRTMAVDIDGSYWLGQGNSDGHLFNVNGTDIEDFTIGDIDYNDLEVDNEGILWAATGGDGLARFNGIDWTYYTIGNDFLSNYIIDIVVSSNEDIYVGGQKGVYIFNGTNFETIPLPYFDPSVYYTFWLYEDLNNNLWISYNTVNGSALAVYDGISATLFDTNNTPLELGSAFGMAQDENDVYWFATCDGLHKYDGVTWATYSDGLSEGCIMEIVVDQYNNKWLGLQQHGIAVFNENGINRLANAPDKCIKGNVFLDINENGIKDNNEFNLHGQTLQLNPNNTQTFSSLLGNFKFNVAENGSYQVNLLLDDPEWVATTDTEVPIELDGDCVEDISFGIYTTSDEIFGEVNMIPSFPRCNTEAPFWLNYKNKGYRIIDGYVELEIDPLMTFISSSPAPTSVDNNVYTWAFSDLYPFQSESIQLVLAYPGVDFLDEIVDSEAKLFGEINGTLELLDEKTIQQTLRCAYDPNDKKGYSNGVSLDDLSLIDDELNYLIRFENTGNDTAFQVTVIDTISNYLDMNTFELVASSHPMRTEINGNIIAFIFENINLPYTEIDSIGSHGFVQYRIKNMENIPNETLIENTAFIYFDFNPPIVTNTTQNILVDEIILSLNNPASQQSNCNFQLSPNPIGENGEIYLPEEVLEEQFYLFDSFGKKVFETTITGNSFKLNRNHLPNGIYFYYFSGKINCSGKIILQ